MLKIGERAPEFFLPNQDGEAVSLSSLLSAGPLLLYFYPEYFALLGLLEARRISQVYDELQSAGLSVAGVSARSPASQRRYMQRLALPFPLLSDPNKTVVRMYDVDGPWGLGVRRATYLISTGRVIRGAVRAGFSVHAHTDFMLDAAEDVG